MVQTDSVRNDAKKTKTEHCSENVLRDMWEVPSLRAIVQA